LGRFETRREEGKADWLGKPAINKDQKEVWRKGVESKWGNGMQKGEPAPADVRGAEGGEDEGGERGREEEGKTAEGLPG